MTLFRFAIITAVATFILLLVGGTVNPTGSSLACPDWPLCYGQFFPKMTGGILYEHSHRLVATLVGLLTVGLAIGIFRRHRDKSLRRLAIVAVLTVILQGVLGGLTVIFKLPLMVSTGHLALAMAFFLLLIYIAFRLRPERVGSVQESPGRGLILTAGLVIYLQIVLGAFVRHTKSGLSCGADIWLCGGSVWPAWAQGQLHMAHRFLGYICFLLVMGVAYVALRESKQQQKRTAYFAAVLAPPIALLQVALGLLTVHTQIGVWDVTLHLGVGALLLALFWMMFLGLGPLGATTQFAAGTSGAASHFNEPEAINQ